VAAVVVAAGAAITAAADVGMWSLQVAGPSPGNPVIHPVRNLSTWPYMRVCKN
jgi:hypothetical protein